MLEMIDIDPSDPTLPGIARGLLSGAVSADLVDDRFDEEWAASLAGASSSFVGVIAASGDIPTGILAGAVDRQRLQLDAILTGSNAEANAEVLDRMITRLLARQDLPEVNLVEFWGKPAREWHELVAERRSFEPLRSLHQLRRPLPVTVPGLETRGFRPGVDDEALRLLNNSSFAGHPDQGDLSPEDLSAKLAEPGVSAAGIRLYEVDGQLAGFCWTKIHTEQGLGEIYAIGLHPDHHGKGLGTAMTASGLHWLHGQGMETGMLYVEGTNVPALHTYAKLGFEIVRTDRAWVTTTFHESSAVR